MTDTPNLSLPLLAPSQAQKHVTVNEALSLVDALCQCRIVDELAAPPASPVEGTVYSVAAGATGLWAAQDGRLALFLNGGWIFVTPKEGWRAWQIADAQAVIYTGSDWAQVATGGGSAPQTAMHAETFEHVVTQGSFNDTAFRFEPEMVMMGVGIEILEDVTGSLTSMTVGHSGDADWFGSGYGLTAGTQIYATSAWPSRSHALRPMRFAANSGEMTGGRLRVTAHYFRPFFG